MFIGLLIVYLSILAPSAAATHYVYLKLFVAIVIILVIASLLGLLFIRKYWLDIKNKEKDVISFNIQKKECKVDYEAGSASLWYTQKMKANNHYLLTIDDNVHDVNKEMFNRANVGDEVNIHTAPISEYLLAIELVK